MRHTRRQRREAAGLGAGHGAARALGRTTLLWLAFCGFAPAAHASLFDVDGVTVSAQAANAVEAKKQAIGEATGKALTTVMQRLTRKEDHGRLPQPGLDKVEDMLSGIAVVKDNATGTHYSATFNFRFDPEAVRILLGHAGIGFVERVSEPVLVVPFLSRDGELALGKDNAYLAAWQALDTANSLTPVRVPTTGIAEQGVSPEAVLAGDYDAMLTLRFLYETRHTLVSRCTITGPEAPVACSLKGETPAGPIEAEETVAATGDVPAALQLAARSLLERLEDQWKTASIVDPGGVLEPDSQDSQTVPVTAAFSGLREWQDLRARLTSVPGVTGVDVVALHAKGAELNVTFLGDVDQLVQMLSAQDLELINTGEQWSLRAY